jgi:hypothetical protein
VEIKDTLAVEIKDALASSLNLGTTQNEWPASHSGRFVPGKNEGKTTLVQALRGPGG